MNPLHPLYLHGANLSFAEPGHASITPAVLVLSKFSVVYHSTVKYAELLAMLHGVIHSINLQTYLGDYHIRTFTVV